MPQLPQAAACSNALMTFSDQPCQNEASSTPDEDPAARTCARAAATLPSRQPVIGTTAPFPAGRRPNRRWRSPRPGRRTARAVMVTATTSGRVEVTTTAPGASRTRLITTYTPLPAPDGPSRTTESRTLVYTSHPRACPHFQPRSVGRGRELSVGRSSPARLRRD